MAPRTKRCPKRKPVPPVEEEAKPGSKEGIISLVEAMRDPRAGSYLAQRISIAIQRGNAASVLGTLPPSDVLDQILRGSTPRSDMYNYRPVRKTAKRTLSSSDESKGSGREDDGDGDDESEQQIEETTSSSHESVESDNDFERESCNSSSYSPFSPPESDDEQKEKKITLPKKQPRKVESDDDSDDVPERVDVSVPADTADKSKLSSMTPEEREAVLQRELCIPSGSKDTVESKEGASVNEGAGGSKEPQEPKRRKFERKQSLPKKRSKLDPNPMHKVPQRSFYGHRAARKSVYRPTEQSD